MSRPLIVAVITFDRFSPFHCSVPCLIFGDKMMPGQSLFELRLCAGDDTRQPASSQGFRMEADYGLEGLLRRISSSSPSGAIRPSAPPNPCSMPWLPPGSGEPR